MCVYSTYITEHHTVFYHSVIHQISVDSFQVMKELESQSVQCEANKFYQLANVSILFLLFNAAFSGCHLHATYISLLCAQTNVRI